MKNYTGLKNNYLIAERFFELKNKKCFWVFKCDCGNEIIQRVDKVLSKSPQVKSYGCTKFKSEYNKEKTLNERLAIHLFYRYRKSAKQRNYSFELSYYFFSQLVSLNCFYCGCQPNRKQYFLYKKEEYVLFNGVDRKDNSIGYTEENCVPCCTICNRVKSDFSFDFFIKWIKNLKNNSLL